MTRRTRFLALVALLGFPQQLGQQLGVHGAQGRLPHPDEAVQDARRQAGFRDAGDVELPARLRPRARDGEDIVVELPRTLFLPLSRRHDVGAVAVIVELVHERVGQAVHLPAHALDLVPAERFHGLDLRFVAQVAQLARQLRAAFFGLKLHAVPLAPPAQPAVTAGDFQAFLPGAVTIASLHGNSMRPRPPPRPANWPCQPDHFQAPSKAPPAQNDSRDLVDFFENLMGDPCSAFWLALVAHVLANYLLGLIPEKQTKNRRCANLVGIAGFALLAYAHFTLSGPNWPSIIILAGLKAWLIASIACLPLLALALFDQEVLRPLGRAWRDFCWRCRNFWWRCRDFWARRRAKRAIARTASQSYLPVPVQPVKLPPTFTSEAAQLHQEFDRMKEAIQALPIPDDEKDARADALEDIFNTRLDRLMERYLR